MASILDIGSGSSDSEDDFDYVPPGNAASSDDSSEDASDDENELDGPASKKAKLSSEDSKSDGPVDKKADDDIWKSFLKGVEQECKKSIGKVGQKEGKSNLPESQNSLKSEKSGGAINAENKEAAACETQDDSKEPSLSGTKEGNEKDIKCETQEGSKKIASRETEEGNKIVDSVKAELSGSSDKSNDSTLASGKNNEKDGSVVDGVSPSGIKAPVARGGISSILGAIANKGKKETVLQKSLQDWNTFKKEEGIEKDLEIFNKGRMGYIERKRFLERSDLRAYESEKEARLFGKKR